MTESRTTLALCGEAASLYPERLDALRIPLGDSDPGLRFQPIGFDRLAGRTLSPRWQDLLLVAAYVHAADAGRARGRGDSLDLAGLAWGRSFDFVIPVRDHDFWRSDQVQNALTRLLESMTGDTAVFRFMPSSAPHAQQDSLFRNADGRPGDLAASRVVLFSGGLDSATRLVELQHTTKDTVAAITLNTRDDLFSRRDTLLHRIQACRLGGVVDLSLRCRKQGLDAERSHRARPMLLGALGAASACALDLREFELPENGIVAINLPLREDVVDARASRTAHPRTLLHLEKLFELVAGHGIRIANPYGDLTRSEVVERLIAHGGKDLIRDTVSCTSAFRRRPKDAPDPATGDGAKTHCGRCTQCIDRRFAMLATGAELSDPLSAYVLDPIMGCGDPPARADVLQSYYVTASEWAACPDPDTFMDENPAVADAAAAIRRRKLEDHEGIEDRLWRLHTRQGTTALSVLSKAVTTNNLRGIRKQLHPDSLLALVGARWASQAPIRSQEEHEPLVPPVAVEVRWRAGRWTRTPITAVELESLERDHVAGLPLIDARASSLRHFVDGQWRAVSERRGGLARYLRARITAPQWASGATVARLLTSTATNETVEKHHPYLKGVLNQIHSGLGDRLAMNGEAGNHTFAFHPSVEVAILLPPPDFSL